MATVTDRRRRRQLCLAVLSFVLAWALAAAPAHAAPWSGHPHRGHDGHATAGPSVNGTIGPRVNGTAGLRATAPTPRAQLGALAQITGLHPSQVSAAALCPAVAVGAARCAAQALVLRGSRRLVRPRVSARRSFTQVLPHVARGIVPAAAAGGSPPGAGTPAYLQQAYDLAYLAQTAGSSQTVAIVDAYDDANAEADLATFRATYGLPPCTSATGCLRKVNEHGSPTPLPSPDSGWETEISLDLDAVSSVCPNCHILLVEASTASLHDMDQAEITAASLGATEISNSWSGASTGPISGTYTFPGVAVVAATGDGGYVGPGWDAYPAAFPGVTAAGGTTLTPASSAAPAARGFSESAWSLSGGWGGGSGCDLSEAKPAYQTDAGCTGRSYADVSADADPSTGLTVYDSANGGWLLAGGTSLATPLIAAYDAITGVNGTTPQWAYADSALLNDPTIGSNGACAASIAEICNAGIGYDGPTGAGSISGAVTPGGPGIGGPSVGSGAGNTYTQSVSATAATLAGGVYPNGLPTSSAWQYGTTAAYGQQTPAADIGAGAAPVTATAALGGLAPGTVYHYRLIAENADGTSYGYDYTLTTPASAPVDTTGATSAAVGPGRAATPIATSPPAIDGATREGHVLRTTGGAWSPAGTDSYQWRRSTTRGRTWRPILGATAASYPLAAADVGHRIEVIVTARSAAGSASASSAAVGPVTAVTAGSAATASAARTPSSASGVLTVGTRVLRTSRGVRLAVADASQLPAAREAISRPAAPSLPAKRRVVVSRVRGVRGALHAWVCSAAGGSRACTRRTTLRATFTFRLPARMRGELVVIVAR
ncbi:MAG TPA: hypothetical protein VIK04_03940 [Solirubrobacteraceae bacterium]